MSEYSILELYFLARDDDKVTIVKEYLKAVGMFRNYSEPSEDPVFSQVMHSNNQNKFLCQLFP